MFMSKFESLPITFFAGYDAPKPDELLSGEVVRDNFGDLALRGFIEDINNPESSIEIQDVKPDKALEVRNVLVVLSAKAPHIKSQDFVDQGTYSASGHYRGRGSAIYLIPFEKK